MGVSVEVWRARIGIFKDGRSTSSSTTVSEVFQWHSVVISLALVNILLLIGSIETNPGPAFQANCFACRSPFNSASAYGRHQAVHLVDKNYSFPCPECESKFKSVQAFTTHHYRYHHQDNTVQLPQAVNIPGSSSAADVFTDVLLDVTYNCLDLTCQESFRTAKELRHHFELHLKNGLECVCPFESCEKTFTRVQTFRTHYSQYHKGHEGSGPNEDIALNLYVNEEGPIGFHDDNDDDDDDDDEDVLMPDEEDQEESEGEEFADCEPPNINQQDNIYPENKVRDFIGKFYLWLEGHLLIPSVKVQAISEELTHLLEMSHHRISVSLKAYMLQAGINALVADRIIDSALKKDVVFNTHHKGMDVVNLSTDYMRKQFFTNRCAYLEPKEIPLGEDACGKKKYAQLLSVKDTLQIMFRDTSVQKQIDDSFSRESIPGVYQDFTDGLAYKNHPICGSRKSIQLIFFQDAFEFYPLSPVAGKYKCVGFYFTLGNVHANVRSKVDGIQLAFIVKETDLKYFGPHFVLKELIAELTDLATNGIDYKGEKLPVTVLHMCGDNLGQHYIGGFVEVFTATYSCRFCEVTKQMLQKDPSCVLPFGTPVDYNQAVAQVNPENPEDNCKGIKSKSVLNQIPHFHVSNQALPPCVGHDILEGVARNDYALFLRYFIKVKKWITFETLNRRIQNFKCKGRDSADSLVKLMPDLKKIRGHASEIWLFIRLFPFFLEDNIQDVEDPVWKLCLLLKQICEYVFAPQIKPNQLVKLKELVRLYVETRAKLFTRPLQPKHHYLSHISDLTVQLGPLIRLWTLRFESRHVFFKHAAKAANNFINITKTLASKYILNFAYKFSGQMYPASIFFRVKDMNSIPQDLRPEVSQILRTDPSFRHILKSVDIHSISYTPGLWVILGSNGQDLIVGEILLIAFNGEKVKFIMKKCIAENTLQGYYKISGDVTFCAALHEDLVDYLPLSAYEHKNNLCLSLKHTNFSMDLI